MSNFVLVHGGWHGGWCWKLVAPYLREAGHEVYTPTLTGLGERAHLLRPDIDLNTHIEDIAAVMRIEDLEDVVLVGHSYGGMVITGVAEVQHARISRLVYLDGTVPLDGQTYLDTLPEEFLGFTSVLWADDQISVAVPPAQFLGIDGRDDVKWVEARLTPQPAYCAKQPIRLESKEAAALPRTYIHCPGDMWSLYGGFYRRAKAEGWETTKVLGGHEAIITDPKAVSEALLWAAG